MATHEAHSHERIRFRTETGSIYEVIRDEAGMRWRRLSSTRGSGPLRTEGASLLTWPEIVVGERCSLWSEPYVAGIPRLVHTSVVVAVLQRHEGETPGAGQADLPQDARPPATPGRRSFWSVRAGDRVTRILGGAPMVLCVTDVDERLIHCGPRGSGWTFDRETGAEVDEELGWGPKFGVTGSYLVHADGVAADESPSGRTARQRRAKRSSTGKEPR
jgi:hypothetical protein